MDLSPLFSCALALVLGALKVTARTAHRAQVHFAVLKVAIGSGLFVVDRAPDAPFTERVFVELVADVMTIEKHRVSHGRLLLCLQVPPESHPRRRASSLFRAVNGHPGQRPATSGACAR